MGDIDALLSGSGVGVLVASHSRQAYHDAADALRVLAERRDRPACRAVAEREFSLIRRALPAYRDLYRQMLTTAS